MVSDYMVGTWLTAGSMCHILTQTGRGGTKPAWRSLGQIQIGSKSHRLDRNYYNSLEEEMELSAPPLSPISLLLPQYLLISLLRRTHEGWFLCDMYLSLLALFIREKLKWFQLIFRVGSLKAF